MATSAEYDQEQRMQQNQMDIGSLIQASVLGKTALRAQVKKLMARDTHIKHEFGVTVCICDHTYTFLGINLCKISWLERNCPPLSHALTMFGVIEAWDEAAPRPSRQVVLFMSDNYDIYAYDTGILFFMAPTMSEFWTAPIVLEYWNGIFPLEVRHRVRQYAKSVDDLIVIFNQVYHQRDVLEARRQKNQNSPRTFARFLCGYVRALLDAERRVREGKIPVPFVDRDSLMANVIPVTLPTPSVQEPERGVDSKKALTRQCSLPTPNPKKVNAHPDDSDSDESIVDLTMEGAASL
ncbi:Rh64 [macacine betaherpesvirus 3]|uniref:RhUL38 n=1 Tax=Rhesus cytomegalovirus (strain 68-1) TaxID=47929 RepID=Q2FAQ6_RHCM6|nr:rhUL38 [macacine betaherpesvirus 3]APT39961.1 Rh64 [macacine betaherpesvirus 3]APT40136.1 Rh64 [macacine betaherpesvirus 3]QQL11095.1 Rh64 [macacine betaherpesvirus 3]QXV50423.1 protein UL38 [macacine betaherpesvirus 3]